MNDVQIRILKAILRSLDSLKTSLDENNEAIREYTQAAKKESRENAPIEVRSELRLPKAIRGYYEAEQRERQSGWRKLVSGLQFIGVATAVILACLTYLTLQKVSSQAEAAHEQARIMRQQLETTDRPWLSIKTSFVGPFVCYPHGGCSTNIGLAFDNVGHMPAVDIRYQFTLLPDEYPHHYHLFSDARRICERIRELKPSVPNLNDPPLPRTIFPGERRWLTHHVSIDAKELDATISFMSQEGGSPGITPLLLECFEYGSETTGKRHHGTAYIFELFNGPPKPGIGHPVINPLAASNIAASELDLSERQADAN